MKDTNDYGFSDYETYTESGEEVNKASRSQDDLKDMIRTEIKNNRPKKKGSWLKLIACVLIGAILGTTGTNLLLSKKIEQQTQMFDSNLKEEIQKLEEKKGLSNVTVENAVAIKALNSVVGITTQTKMPSNDFFSNMQEQIVEGVGSGVVMSKDGYILTNSHVVSDGKAENIQVLLNDGTKGTAQLLWNDPTLDLAVIKTNLKNLHPAELGDSSKVTMGDKAIAIGNPLGLELQSTLTSGYISGLDRTIVTQKGTQMDGLLQTDAAINQGNSGGGLFDATGKLIGINTAKASAEGIGFSIPINTAKTVVDSIVKTGKYEPIMLGISGVDVMNYAQAGGNIQAEQGVVVMSVMENSSAAKAGIQKGDIIAQVDQEEISTMSSLKQVLIRKKAGDTSKIVVLRNGKKMEMNITFEQATQEMLENQNPKNLQPLESPEHSEENIIPEENMPQEQEMPEESIR